MRNAAGQSPVSEGEGEYRPVSIQISRKRKQMRSGLKELPLQKQKQKLASKSRGNSRIPNIGGM